MDRERRRSYFNRCDPDQPLDPGDPRNFDIDHESGHPRGVIWAEELASRIEFAQDKAHVLFTGLPGSGKSTELRRLARRLETSGFLPVLIDARALLDLTREPDVPEIIAAVVLRTEWALQQIEAEPLAGTQPDPSITENHRFWHWLTTSEIATGGAALEQLKNNPSFRGQIREKLRSELAAFLEAARAHLQYLNDRCRKAGRAGLVILMDSLEKLGGMASAQDEVMAGAERLFADGAPHLRLPVPALYTFPPALTLRLNANVHFMPMIKLRTLAGERWAPGFNAARELVRRRIDDEALSDLLGLEAEDRVGRLLDWSGGYPREIMHLLREILLKDKVDDAIFKRLLGMAGDRIRRTVTDDAQINWLAQVAEKHALIFTEEERPAAMRLLTNSVVLRYQNDTEWFDVHPAVREMPRFQAALEASRRRKSDG